MIGTRGLVHYSQKSFTTHFFPTSSMFRHWNHILIAALAATSLVLQPVSAGAFQCVNCCDSQAGESCCQPTAESSCCSSRDAECSQIVRSSCCGEGQRPAGCHCGKNDESPAETPLPEPPAVDGVFESLAALSLTTWTSLTPTPQLERVAFQRSPVARSAPPAKQLMLCVWRT